MDDTKLDKLTELATEEVIARLAPPQVKLCCGESQCNTWLQKMSGDIFVESIQCSSEGLCIVYNEGPKISREKLSEEIRTTLDRLIQESTT